VVLSNDGGETWWPMGISTAVTRIHCVAFSADGTLWLGSREGVYFTSDKGKTWMWVHRLPLVDVSDLFYDAQSNRVLVSSRGSDFIYVIDVKNARMEVVSDRVPAAPGARGGRPAHGDFAG
jgi:photosystem II stability/assembly factor-like uncharacterized protein